VAGQGSGAPLGTGGRLNESDDKSQPRRSARTDRFHPITVVAEVALSGLFLEAHSDASRLAFCRVFDILIRQFPDTSLFYSETECVLAASDVSFFRRPLMA